MSYESSIDDGRWAAVWERDKEADGRFFYSVRTTGVYCRPSCPSRPAKRENIAFHDSPADAEAAGFHPRKRCDPAEQRPAREPEAIRAAIGQFSLGYILVAATEMGVCAILLGDDPDALVQDLRLRFGTTQILTGDPDFETLVAKVVDFAEQPGQDFDLALDVRGTAFQQKVWQSLGEIETGKTASYGEIARRIGAPDSARSIAEACAANSLAIVIPCHRVVRGDGSISGYAWGVERKRVLLSREATFSRKAAA